MLAKRLLQVSIQHSFFLFGARGTGKTTLINQTFQNDNTMFINLLNPEEEDLFSRAPETLAAMVRALPQSILYVVIDEIQKISKLLDVVHDLIETTDKIFIMTGSSARKLKRGGANLLAGRAFVYHLFPFSFIELGDHFSLEEALHFGLLPKVYNLLDIKEREQFLQAYTHTYLKEEIVIEQIIRNLDPFRRFLEVAAQSNGKIINYANIARDVGADDKTVKAYYTILEDTLLGFFLEPFHHSFRKRLTQKPKFYFFDTGVARALSRMLSVPLKAGTSFYGEVFEQFIIVECFKLGSYFKPEYRFSYFQTKDGAEIDLIIDRPGQKPLAIEIKSSVEVTETALSGFIRITSEFDCEAICLSQDKHLKVFEHVNVFPWDIGLRQIFTT